MCSHQSTDGDDSRRLDLLIHDLEYPLAKARACLDASLFCEREHIRLALLEEAFDSVCSASARVNRAYEPEKEGEEA